MIECSAAPGAMAAFSLTDMVMGICWGIGTRQAARMVARQRTGSGLGPGPRLRVAAGAEPYCCVGCVPCHLPSQRMHATVALIAHAKATYAMVSAEYSRG